MQLHDWLRKTVKTGHKGVSTWLAIIRAGKGTRHIEAWKTGGVVWTGAIKGDLLTNADGREEYTWFEGRCGVKL